MQYLSTAILLQFRFYVFGFCACTNIKRVPGYKATDPDVQFMNNYPDNRVSVPALLYIAKHIQEPLKEGKTSNQNVLLGSDMRNSSAMIVSHYKVIIGILFFSIYLVY